MNTQFQFGKWEDLIVKIPSGTIDLVYTDPPYGIGYRSNIPGDIRWNKTGNTESKFDKPILNDNHGDIDFDLFAKEIFRVLKDDTFVFLHCNVIWIGRNLDCFTNAGFSYKGTIASDKQFAIGGDLHGAMKRDWEPILYLAKGKPALRPVMVKRMDGSKNLVAQKRNRISEISDWQFQLGHKEKCGFPTQKPSALCKRIIELSTDAGNVILDPFAGSGTIGKMAVELGRESISFEADQVVFEKFLKEKGTNNE